MVKLTVSPTVASPPTVPVTSIVLPASAAFTMSSGVMSFTVIIAAAAVSTVWVDVVVAVNGLPAASVPVTVASKLVLAAKSAPSTAML